MEKSIRPRYSNPHPRRHNLPINHKALIVVTKNQFDGYRISIDNVAVSITVDDLVFRNISCLPSIDMKVNGISIGVIWYADCDIVIRSYRDESVWREANCNEEVRHVR